MKAIVLLLLAAIVISLGSGLFYMTGKKQDSAKLLKALKVRVALSIVLILFLTSAFYFGGIS
tara:strand:- start:3848 stop:4033 length:186 start_codon:yes stop_codon:yes gene_type:complete